MKTNTKSKSWSPKDTKVLRDLLTETRGNAIKWKEVRETKPAAYRQIMHGRDKQLVYNKTNQERAAFKASVNLLPASVSKAPGRKRRKRRVVMLRALAPVTSPTPPAKAPFDVNFCCHCGTIAPKAMAEARTRALAAV